jgi:protein-disulfide isomerase
MPWDCGILKSKSASVHADHRSLIHISHLTCHFSLLCFKSVNTTHQLPRCFEMTRHHWLTPKVIALSLGLAGCAGSEVKEGDAKAVAPGAATDGAADPRIAVADTNRIQGNPNTTVWLVMASDFQCPACKYWHDTHAPEIMRDYVATGKVRFAYTNFPLDHIHPNARAAAEAGMCAAAQGKFWGMHDRIFATQTEWAAMPDPTPLFRRLATESSVDTVAWNQCLADDVTVPLVEGDHARGRAGGVDQTPFFFIGNQKVGGAIPAARLRSMLDAAIAQAGGTSR